MGPIRSLGGTLRDGAAVFSVCTLLFVGSRGNAAAPEAKLVLEKIDFKTADLNPKQTRVLQRITKSHGAETVQVARLHADAVAADTPLVLHLTGDKKVEMTGQKIYGEKTRRVEWKGTKASEAAILSIAEKSATGLVYTGDKVYAVEPIGGGLQAVSLLDQRKFKKDHPESFENIEKKAKPKKDGKEPRKPDADAPPVVITVLVAYTPKVDDLQADVNSLITAAVDLANLSYQNSKINLKLELVHTVKVDYTESATHDLDLERFRKKGDGVMDEIHMLRDTKKADVCVLLINNDEFCGLAADILAEKDTAFAVVHHDCAVKNLSFPHEIGHLQGARHNLEVDPTIDPSSPWNHGYLSTTGNWRTIMAYPTSAQPNRIPFWSNPDVMHLGEAMGTTTKQNNARMLRESAPKISMFR